MTTLTGIIKWFDETKGVGIIAPHAGGEDVFVHHSEIRMAFGLRSVPAGMQVQYGLRQGTQRVEAVNVRCL